MHKNSYNPKSLNGNWYENRQTSDFEAQNNGSNTYLSNPCKHWLDNICLLTYLLCLHLAYNKYVPISRDVGNKSSYNKVSIHSSTTILSP